MWHPVDRLSVIVLDSGLASMLLLAIATLAMVVTRQPARRLRLARTAMYGLLAFLPLIGLRLVPRFDLIDYFADRGFLPHPVLEPASEAFDQLVKAPSAIGRWPLRVLVILYCIGVTFRLCWLALGYLAVFWLKWTSEPPSLEALELLDSLPLAPGARRPGLKVAARATRPMLVGTFRPLILIPGELDEPGQENAARLKLCILHELAHVEASDPWFGLVENLATVFWFFLPPLWWIASQVKLDQEFLADRRAATSFGPLRGYASALVELATVPAQAVPGLSSSRFRWGETRSPLFQRVLMLLRCPFPLEAKPPEWWSVGVPCFTVILTLGFATLTFRPPHPIPVSVIAPNTHQFALAHLELPPAAANSEGRVPIFKLPVRVPEQFRLRMEVWGDSSNLSRVRVAGIPLKSSAELGEPEQETWHDVEISRDGDAISVRIDDRPIPSNEPETSKRFQLTDSLSIESAPESRTIVQNLLLSW